MNKHRKLCCNQFLLIYIVYIDKENKTDTGTSYLIENTQHINIIFYLVQSYYMHNDIVIIDVTLCLFVLFVLFVLLNIEDA